LNSNFARVRGRALASPARDDPGQNHWARCGNPELRNAMASRIRKGNESVREESCASGPAAAGGPREHSHRQPDGEPQPHNHADVNTKGARSARRRECATRMSRPSSSVPSSARAKEIRAVAGKILAAGSAGRKSTGAEAPTGQHENQAARKSNRAKERFGAGKKIRTALHEIMSAHRAEGDQ